MAWCCLCFVGIVHCFVFRFVSGFFPLGVLASSVSSRGQPRPQRRRSAVVLDMKKKNRPRTVGTQPEEAKVDATTAEKDDEGRRALVRTIFVVLEHLGHYARYLEVLR